MLTFPDAHSDVFDGVQAVGGELLSAVFALRVSEGREINGVERPHIWWTMLESCLTSLPTSTARKEKARFDKLGASAT